MKFNTEKNKITKITDDQETIDNGLFHKENKSRNNKAVPTTLKTITTLYESEYVPFSTDRAYGSSISIAIDMPIVANNIAFTDEINIIESLIPYVRHSIIVKKPINGEIRGLYTANISGYNNNPDTQNGVFQENKTIYRQLPGGGLVVVGNTGSGEGTSSNGDELVTVTSHESFTIDQQKNIYSDNSVSSLIWNKISDNTYSFSIGKQAMFIMPSDEDIGTTNTEGDRVYVATVQTSPYAILFYIVTDNRIVVSYPAYRPIEIDIEAKIILSIPSRNLWEEYSQYEN